MTHVAVCTRRAGRLRRRSLQRRQRQLQVPTAGYGYRDDDDDRGPSTAAWCARASIVTAAAADRSTRAGECETPVSPAPQFVYHGRADVLSVANDAVPLSRRCRSNRCRLRIAPPPPPCFCRVAPCDTGTAAFSYPSVDIVVRSFFYNFSIPFPTLACRFSRRRRHRRLCVQCPSSQRPVVERACRRSAVRSV